VSATTASAAAVAGETPRAPAGPAAPGPTEPWAAFVTARTPQAYFSGWLEVVCARFPEVRAAALLVHADGGASLMPIAVWPSATADLSRLTSTLQRTVGEQRGLIDHVTQPPAGEQPAAERAAPFVPVTRIGYPVMMGERVAGAVVLESVFGSSATFAHQSATLPGVSRSFVSFAQAEQEIGASRVYLGFHFRRAVTQGLKQGRQVGAWAMQHLMAPA